MILHKKSKKKTSRIMYKVQLLLSHVYIVIHVICMEVHKGTKIARSTRDSRLKIFYRNYNFLYCTYRMQRNAVSAVAALLPLAVHVVHVQPEVLQYSPSLHYLIEIIDCHTPAKENTNTIY